MSIVWLILLGLVCWTLVSVAVGLWLGRILALQRRGGTLDFTWAVNTTGVGHPGSTMVPEGSVAYATKPGDEGQSAA